MGEAWRMAAIALVLAALLGPVSYCAVESGRIAADLERDLARACIEGGGNWAPQGWWNSNEVCWQPTGDSP